jgi:diguanylate cyclase (GGDEF)-like protein
MRLKNAMLGTIAYAVCFALWLYLYFMDRWFVSLPTAFLLMLPGLFTHFTYMFIIASGRNLRFKDPSLTLAQITTAILVNQPVLYFMDENGRGILLFTYLYPFMFAILRLNYKQCFFVAFLSILTYVNIIGLLLLNHPERVDMEVEWLRVTIFAGSMMWLAFFAGYTSRIRASLRRKNIENRELMQQLERLAERDELTGLFNRRKFWERLTEEKSRAKRSGHTFSVALIDLDHFKKVNDTYGHPVGDTVLRTFSHLMEDEFRSSDVIARYGGEEFVVLMCETNLNQAAAGLNRLQKALRKLAFDGGPGKGNFHVTFSSGVALYKIDEPLEETLNRADTCLYMAKQEGRNQSVDEESAEQIKENRSRKSHELTS